VIAQRMGRMPLGAIVVLLTVVQTSNRAQQPPVLPNRDAELIRMQLPLQQMQPTAELVRQWATHPQQSFGGFNESRAGFRSITVTLERTPFECDDRFRGEKHSHLRVIVAVERATSTDYWVAPEKPEGKPCQWDMSPNWAIVNGDQDLPPVEFAGPDGVPIFRIRVSDLWGNITRVEPVHDLILDVRGGRPVLAARLSSADVYGHCDFPDKRPFASCEWSDERQDFLCTETFDDARRHVWMVSGELVTRPPGSKPPWDVAEFLTTLDRDSQATGKWAEPTDVGAVRLIARIPSRRTGRQIFLFGASPDLGEPFILAVRDGKDVRVVRIKVQDYLGPSHLADALKVPPTMPVAEYRPSGEPPRFDVRPLSQSPTGPRLFAVVMSRDEWRTRTFFHLAIEETPAAAVAAGVMVATSSDDRTMSLSPLDARQPLDICSDDVGGFALPGQVTLSPLQIEYDVEPVFQIVDGAPARDASKECAASAHVVWRSGEGFVVNYGSGACSTERFRAVHIGDDGRVEVRTRVIRPGSPVESPRREP
jgi:hypothetical protein